MTTDTTTFGYSHTQKAPLCLLVYALAAVFLALGWFVRDAPPIPWLFPPIGLLMLVIAASFHHLTVEDQGDVLSVRFGPIPLFRTTVKYSDIVSAAVGRTLLLDGWGIHMSVRGGWVWNLWGRDCVVVGFRTSGTLRIGTDDAENLAAFLRSRMDDSRHDPNSNPIDTQMRPDGSTKAARPDLRSSAVEIVEGDLLDQDVEVIVNAWNRNIIPWWLLLPQGVSGAIKRRGGTTPFKEVRRHGSIPLGGAVLTSAGKLPFKGIIHVAGINLLWRSSEWSIRDSVKNAM
ncbi:MAG: hypothetical protein RL215_1936, partial [Planctomycetota bacterium]